MTPPAEFAGVGRREGRSSSPVPQGQRRIGTPALTYTATPRPHDHGDAVQREVDRADDHLTTGPDAP